VFPEGSLKVVEARMRVRKSARRIPDPGARPERLGAPRRGDGLRGRDALLAGAEGPQEERREVARQGEVSSGSDGPENVYVLRSLSAAEQPIHVPREGLAQLERVPERTMGVVLGTRIDAVDPRRRAFHGADLELALSEVAPVGVSNGEALS
jgi:hypothetical protein